MQSADPVRAQYEAFPYPERDPADERRRLVLGSPSHPLEVDHFLYGGRRDWSAPFRALVAGGGTGDALVMLAAKLAEIGCPAELVYLDLSRASREVAEARLTVRGLKATFVTGDLREAPALGPFDYIDCCGVLHHLDDPDAGFAALAAALAPEGGMGLMVYAPLGRTGVYPLQEAFGTLFEGEAPQARLGLAKAVLRGLPRTNWLVQNAYVGDHKVSDAGIYDLLLHGRDRPYAIEDLLAALARAGLGLVSLTEPARYDPLRYLPAAPEIEAKVQALGPAARMGLAERLSGAMKTHVLYATHAGRAPMVAERRGPHDRHVAYLRADPAKLADRVAAQGWFSLTLDGVPHKLALFGPRSHMPAGLPAAAADARRLCPPLLRAMDGRRRLADIPEALAAPDLLAGLVRTLEGFNLVHLSEGARP